MENKLLIDIRDVTVQLGEDDNSQIALNHVSTQLKKGEWIAIIGANGSGKSTFSKLLARVYKPSKGICTFPDTNPEQAEFSVHLVMQSPEAQIIGDTVREELSYSLAPHSLSPAKELQRVQDVAASLELIEHLDDQVDTLSGGQKQLLCIASALLLQRSLVIFDEATTMIDTKSRSKVYSLAKKLHEQGATIVWATHDMEEVLLAERVLYFDQGQIRFDGKPTEFFQKSLHHSGESNQFMFPIPYSLKFLEEWHLAMGTSHQSLS